MKIPTSRDIYIEADGKKVAIVQSYTAKTQQESKQIEAFGSEYPVASVSGRQNHILELKKVVPLLDEAEQTDFYHLSDFTLMIVKPDCRIVYSGCQWNEICETVNLNQPCIETVKLTALKRMVIR